MKKRSEAELWKEAKLLACRPYAVEVVELDQEDRKRFPEDICVTNPELPGCFSEGCTWEEAVENLREARELYIYTLLEVGEEVPTPYWAVEYGLNIVIDFANVPPQYRKLTAEIVRQRSEFIEMKVR